MDLHRTRRGMASCRDKCQLVFRIRFSAVATFKNRDRVPMKMTTEEAFVKVLQRHGIEHVFGIIGSAFMPISDLFPSAGITFWDCAHEGSGGMMADGFTR